MTDLIDLTLAVEYVNSKLVDVVPFAEVDIEEKVDIMLAKADLAWLGYKLIIAFHVYPEVEIFFVKTIELAC